VVLQHLDSITDDMGWRAVVDVALQLVVDLHNVAKFVCKIVLKTKSTQIYQ
jgi:hypothetical protein